MARRATASSPFAALATRPRLAGRCLVPVLLAATGLPAAAQPAPPAPPPAAADLCVICEEPNALYRCRADGADPAAPPAPGVQIKCVTEIAQRKAHGRCRIDRARGAAPCDGIYVAVVPPPPPLAGTGDAAKAAPPAPAAAPAAQPPAPDPNKPPETVEALAKEAVRKSNESMKETSSAAERQMEKAGSAVGGALKKSWDCLSSFFSRC